MSWHEEYLCTKCPFQSTMLHYPPKLVLLYLHVLWQHADAIMMQLAYHKLDTIIRVVMVYCPWVASCHPSQVAVSGRVLIVNLESLYNRDHHDWPVPLCDLSSLSGSSGLSCLTAHDIDRHLIRHIRPMQSSIPTSAKCRSWNYANTYWCLSSPCHNCVDLIDQVHQAPWQPPRPLLWGKSKKPPTCNLILFSSNPYRKRDLLC